MGVDNWKEYQLEDLAAYINGRSFKPSEWEKEGLPILRIQNLTKSTNTVNHFNGDYEEKHFIKNGDILLAWSATLDIFWWKEGNALLNQHIFKVKPNEKIVDRRFYYYLIRNILTEIRSKTHGTGMTHITKPKLLSIKVKLPDMKVQRELVKKLDAFFKEYKILKEEKLRAITNYAKLPFAFFKKYADKIECQETTVGGVLSDIKYGTSNKANTQEKGYPILRMNNITSQGTLDLRKLKHIEMDKSDFKKYSLKKGDILINRTNSQELVGKCGVFDVKGDYVFASYLIRMRVKPELVLPEYLVFYLSLGPGRQEINSRVRGVTNQWNINSKEIMSIPIMIPSIDNQKKILSEFNTLVNNHTIKKERKNLINWIEQLPHSVLAKTFKEGVIA